VVGRAGEFIFVGNVRQVLNLETEQQVKYQAYWLLADGSERVDYTQRVLVVEKVETPPQENLEILSRVVKP
jgi:hypothetical protein